MNTSERLRIDLLQHTRRTLARAFADELQAKLAAAPEYKRTLVIAEEAYKLLEIYQTGLEDQLKQWQEYAEDAVAMNVAACLSVGKPQEEK